MQQHITAVTHYLRTLQNTICHSLQQEEPATTFQTDQWTYHSGGGGQARILEGGKTFEKAGVNFSHIHGKNLPPSATKQRPELHQRSYQALGISLVIHPCNPFVPTTHANVRFFVAQSPTEEPIWWFGGGFDLTPYYGFSEDAVHWHHTAKQACDPFGPEVYPRYKKWCDEYFYLPHRQEPRGIGGIFFDDLNEWGLERCFEFMQHVGDHFIPAYLPIVTRRKTLPYTAEQQAFQQYRRGRYVEFNLLHDRGTLFGLQSQGRTESILMSLPPQAAWRYNWHPEPGSAEAELYEKFLIAKDWL